jgi:hypothetical protein
MAAKSVFGPLTPDVPAASPTPLTALTPLIPERALIALIGEVIQLTSRG